MIYEPRCIAAGIAIERSLSPSRMVVLRRGVMMQVVSNLITNAIYAMPTDGTLSVTVCDTESPAEGVFLTVADNGVGIEADLLPKVFDAFFTMRPTIGTGIGLFVAKQFVEGHGRKIDIESHVAEARSDTAQWFVFSCHLILNTKFRKSKQRIFSPGLTHSISGLAMVVCKRNLQSRSSPSVISAT